MLSQMGTRERAVWSPSAHSEFAYGAFGRRAGRRARMWPPSHLGERVNTDLGRTGLPPRRAWAPPSCPLCTQPRLGLQPWDQVPSMGSLEPPPSPSSPVGILPRGGGVGRMADRALARSALFQVRKHFTDVISFHRAVTRRFKRPPTNGGTEASAERGPARSTPPRCPGSVIPKQGVPCTEMSGAVVAILPEPQR